MPGQAPSALPPATWCLTFARGTHSVLGQLCHKVLSYIEHKAASLYCICSVFPSDWEQTIPSSAWSPEEKAALMCLLNVFWAQPPMSSILPPKILLCVCLSSWGLPMDMLPVESEPSSKPSSPGWGKAFTWVHWGHQHIHGTLCFCYSTSLCLTFLICQRGIKIVLTS